MSHFSPERPAWLHGNSTETESVSSFGGKDLKGEHLFCMWGYRGCEHISMENEGYWDPSSWSEYPVPHFCTVHGVVTLLWDPIPFWEFCSGTGHRSPSFAYCLFVCQLYLSQVLKRLFPVFLPDMFCPSSKSFLPPSWGFWSRSEEEPGALLPFSSTPPPPSLKTSK